MQTDPIGHNAGMNVYAYVGNDPVTFVDPLGLQCAGCGDGITVSASPLSDAMAFRDSPAFRRGTRVMNGGPAVNDDPEAKELFVAGRRIHRARRRTPWRSPQQILLDLIIQTFTGFPLGDGVPVYPAPPTGPTRWSGR
jgi:uncharacterized protein RhaS with RHS repeats